jgi:hypothetical protein
MQCFSGVKNGEVLLHVEKTAAANPKSQNI